MKPLLLFLSIILSVTVYGQNRCPVAGGSSNSRFQHLDSLKNRPPLPLDLTKAPVVIPVSLFLEPGNDTARWNENAVVTIAGYIVGVKYGGSETCNCHSADQTAFDYHIEIADTTDPVHGHIMVCEVSRYTRAVVGYSIGQLKALIGRQVKLTGYLFYDQEHWANAFNTNPTGGNDWRQTCWELHPVFDIDTE